MKQTFLFAAKKNSYTLSKPYQRIKRILAKQRFSNALAGVFFVFFLMYSFGVKAQDIPLSFTKITTENSGIEINLRYAGNHNFIGKPIDGYFNDKVVIVTKQTAIALNKVQQHLKTLGYGLKIYDAYRPQRAVNHFVRWARDIKDTLQKHEYYPNTKKRYLFNKGYIASRSGHSRGSTVDLTLIELDSKEELDMGGSYDFFGERSGVYYKDITNEQRKNRALLRVMMMKYNFRIYHKEWWHFTLRNEPFPKTYFDFVIR